MKKIEFDLKGGALGPDDIVELDGVSIPCIQRVEISSDIWDVPRLNIFTVVPVGKAEFDNYQATIHQLEAAGMGLENYRSLLKQRDILQERCKLLEGQLGKKSDE